MPFLNFGGNKNKYCNLSDMNFFMITNVIIVNRYSDPDPLFPNVDPRIRIRIHVKMRWIRNADLEIRKAGKKKTFYGKGDL